MRFKILVVDDCDDIRDLLTMLFESEGYEVSQASDGVEALSRIGQGLRPDLIFLDHNMEQMDGPEFLNALEISHSELASDVPVILFTGHEPDKIHDFGATEILRKSLGLEELLSVVRKYQ